MPRIVLEVPPGALSALRLAPEEFAAEMRLAAAIKWYEQERISQSKAAEIAGISRSEFLDALARYGVSPFQYTAQEIIGEVQDGWTVGGERLTCDPAGKDTLRGLAEPPCR